MFCLLQSDPLYVILVLFWSRIQFLHVSAWISLLDPSRDGNDWSSHPVLIIGIPFLLSEQNFSEPLTDSRGCEVTSCVSFYCVSEKLYNSQGPELRRSLFSLKQLFQVSVSSFRHLGFFSCWSFIGWGCWNRLTPQTCSSFYLLKHQLYHFQPEWLVGVTNELLVKLPSPVTEHIWCVGTGSHVASYLFELWGDFCHEAAHKFPVRRLCLTDQTEEKRRATLCSHLWMCVFAGR